MNPISGIPNVEFNPRIYGDYCRVPGEGPGDPRERRRRHDDGAQRRRVTHKYKSEGSADLSVI